MLRIGLAGQTEAVYALLTRLLPDTPDPDLALIHLERYCRDGPPPANVEAFQVLLSLFGFSPYLAESIINDRGYLETLVRARRQGAWGLEEYRNELARWMRVAHAEDPWDALRTFKRRSFLRIALKDLQRSVTLVDVCREISCAADALIQAGLEIVVADLIERYGRPQAYDESGRVIEVGLAVIALGKLGGMELNYSSDVDLLFLYGTDGETTGSQGNPETQISNKEFFTKAAEALSMGLSQISPEGRVFRIDCRLRPGGRDGDLVAPLRAALVYYKSWARPWERQALIKARPCAGDRELGVRFISSAEAAIYQTTPDPGAIDAIRELKDRIDADLSRRGEGASHLKLGMGGIREIEFTVQAQQILHGAPEPWIRESNSLLGLHKLADKGYLSISVYGALSTAYAFLREVEHRLQIHGNLQRSVLPSAPREQRVLARSMGYRDSVHRQEAASFLADLDAHRAAVRAIYDSVFGKLSQVSLDRPPGPDPFLDSLPDADAEVLLQEAGITDPRALLGSVKAISRLMAPPLTSATARRGFRHVTPALLRELASVHNPVRALRNLERFLASVSIEKGGLIDLLGRPELFPPLARLFSGSQPLSSTLIHRPGLVVGEGFAPALARDRTVGAHLEKLVEVWRGSADLQRFATFLRHYQSSQTVLIGLKDLNRQAGPASIARALSDLAEAILRAAVAACASSAGWSQAAGRDQTLIPGFVVLGLGKLGYRELDYSSDLDLVFLYDSSGDEDPQRHAAANRLAEMTIDMLTSITKDGSLYAVDTRLRPFGREGELAQPLSRLAEYFSSSAGVWEMQSYLKARPLAGDLDRGWETTRRLEAVLLDRARDVDLSGAVRQMKERLEQEARTRNPGQVDIKLGPGGLNAIQFAIQFLQLRHGVPSPPHKRTTRLLATLRAAGLLDEEAYRVLFTGFQFIRRLEHQLRLIQGRALSRLPASGEALEEVAFCLGYSPQGDLSARDRLVGDLGFHQRRIEATYRRVIEQAALLPVSPVSPVP